MAQFCQVFRCIFCFCAVDTIGNTDHAAIHSVHCCINCFAGTCCNFYCTAAFCAVTENTCYGTHHVLDGAADLFKCAAHHVCHTRCRTCTCYHRAANGAQTANMFFHVHDHQHCHKFRSQQFFFGNVHFFCENSHGQCCGNPLITAAAECHNGTVTAIHTEVCCCRRDHSDCCHNICCHPAFIHNILDGRAYAKSVFLFHTDFCDFHIHIDRFFNELQFFYIYFICPVVEFFERMCCYIKAAFCFHCCRSFFFCAVIHDHFAVFFIVYHVIMGILCDGVCFFVCVCCDTFNIEATAFQNFYTDHTCSYQFFCFYHVFRFDFCTDFHRVAGFRNQRTQNACQFNTVCTCVGDLNAVCVFENVGADDHIQFFGGRRQFFTCSGNSQSNSNGFCTAHAGFHFCFDCV